MNAYIKIKESPPFYIGRLTLETKGIGNRFFHQMMFPKPLPSNSLGMVSIKIGYCFPLKKLAFRGRARGLLGLPAGLPRRPFPTGVRTFLSTQPCI
ncbi:hypothetical protein E2R55_19000 [Vibrio vulnificus]|nr:hypothetical protein E2R55_19000 [Vibrio vulnificus]